VEVTPQTALSDTPEGTSIPQEPETLSACEPPTAAVEESERPVWAGEIEIPALSAEAEVEISHRPEQEGSAAETQGPAGETGTGEPTGGTTEDTGQEKDEL
jgi:hypothetical protein